MEVKTDAQNQNPPKTMGKYIKMEKRSKLWRNVLHLRMQEKKQSHCANCIPPLRCAPAQRDAPVTLQAAERGEAVGAVALFLFLHAQM